MGKKRPGASGSSRKRSGLNTQQWVILTVVAAMIVGAMVIAGTGGLGVLPSSPSGGGSPAAGALALVDKGNAAYDAKDYVAAIGYYEQALQERANDVNMLVDLGTAYYYKQPPDPTRALYYYDKALQIDPKFPNGLFNKAVVLAGGREDYVGAIAVLQEFLKYYPSGQQSDRARQMVQEFEPYAKRTSTVQQPQAGVAQTTQPAQPTQPVNNQPAPAPGSPLSTGFGN